LLPLERWLYLCSKTPTAPSSSLKKSFTFLIPFPVEISDKQSVLARCKAGRSLDFCYGNSEFSAILSFTHNPPCAPEDPQEGWFGPAMK